MRILKTKTQAEVEAIIEKVVSKLTSKYKFGYYDLDDIKQEARAFAIKGLDGYNEALPLENFLSSHIKKRLLNLRRDKYKRNDPPCSICHAANGEATKHEDGQYCNKYLAWKKRNLSKQNIMAPLDISNISDEKESTTRIESSVLEDVEVAELLKIIDERLPVELRATYLQMRAGVKIPKAKREEVEHTIIDILGTDICLTNKEENVEQ